MEGEPTIGVQNCQYSAFLMEIILQTYRRDGVVVRASVSQSVDPGFISQVESYQKTLNIVFTA